MLDRFPNCCAILFEIVEELGVFRHNAIQRQRSTALFWLAVTQT